MSSYIEIGREYVLTLQDYWNLINGDLKVKISDNARLRMEKSCRFIHNLLEREEKVYGVTTGFADLRTESIEVSKCSILSRNLIHSHDAGIGKSKPHEIVLGAMLIRANSIVKGYSGFTVKNLQILLDMINHRITPRVPINGGLGASGDLLDSSRVGMAMSGQPVKVFINGKFDPETPTADLALKKFGITPAEFGPKEGLALTNGTCFLCSSACFGYLRLVRVMETMLSITSMFLNSIHCVEDAFTQPLHHVRKHVGQTAIAKLLHQFVSKSPFLDVKDVQNDYCVRCLPQIFGYHYEEIHSFRDGLLSEMNAATDNPLFFCGSEVTKDVPLHRIHDFEGEKWAVLSGGNFHGEYIAQKCDNLTRCNVKPVLAIERHLTYVLNPFRHKRKELPVYLIYSEKGTEEEKKKEIGLRSGFMITQYCGNALAHKISFMGNPMTTSNITSANESEDVVSFGTSASYKLVEQVELMEDFCIVYGCEIMQAYSISRAELIKENPKIEKELGDLICEKVFQFISSKLVNHKFPIVVDMSFGTVYEELRSVLLDYEKNDNFLRRLIGFPYSQRNSVEEESEGENEN